MAGNFLGSALSGVGQFFGPRQAVERALLNRGIQEQDRQRQRQETIDEQIARETRTRQGSREDFELEMGLRRRDTEAADESARSRRSAILASTGESPERIAMILSGYDPRANEAQQRDVMALTAEQDRLRIGRESSERTEKERLERENDDRVARALGITPDQAYAFRTESNVGRYYSPVPAITGRPAVPGQPAAGPIEAIPEIPGIPDQPSRLERIPERLTGPAAETAELMDLSTKLQSEPASPFAPTWRARIADLVRFVPTESGSMQTIPTGARTPITTIDPTGRVTQTGGRPSGGRNAATRARPTAPPASASASSLTARLRELEAEQEGNDADMHSLASGTNSNVNAQNFSITYVDPRDRGSADDRATLLRKTQRARQLRSEIQAIRSRVRRTAPENIQSRPSLADERALEDHARLDRARARR